MSRASRVESVRFGLETMRAKHTCGFAGTLDAGCSTDYVGYLDTEDLQQFAGLVGDGSMAFWVCTCIVKSPYTLSS